MIILISLFFTSKWMKMIKLSRKFFVFYGSMYGYPLTLYIGICKYFGMFSMTWRFKSPRICWISLRFSEISGMPRVCVLMAFKHALNILVVSPVFQTSGPSEGSVGPLSLCWNSVEIETFLCWPGCRKFAEGPMTPKTLGMQKRCRTCAIF